MYNKSMKKNVILNGFKSIVSGACIALGAMGYIIVLSTSNTGVVKLLASLTFCIGLYLSIITQGILFTGQTVQVKKMLLLNFLAKAEHPIENCFATLTKVWYLNLLGALFIVCVMTPFTDSFNNTLANVVTVKAELGIIELFFKGMLCNILVGIAIDCCSKAKSYTDIAIAILVPITTFVLCGCEHSVADMFFFLAYIFKAGRAVAILKLLAILVIVTLGNLTGGIAYSIYKDGIEESERKAV